MTKEKAEELYPELATMSILELMAERGVASYNQDKTRVEAITAVLESRPL